MLKTHGEVYAAKSLLSTIPLTILGALGGAGILSLSAVGISTLCLGALGITISCARHGNFQKGSWIVELAIPIIGILGITKILPTVGYVALGFSGYVLLTSLCVIKISNRRPIETPERRSHKMPTCTLW